MINIQKKITLTTILIVLNLALLYKPSYAQLGSIAPPPATNVSIDSLVSAFANTAASIGIVGFLIMFIWGCYEWISSAGDKAQLDKAKSRITQGVIGVALLASVWVIFTIVRNFTYTGPSNIQNAPLPIPITYNKNSNYMV